VNDAGKPSLSVVIPHLNQPEHLEKCLKSLHAQTRTIDDVEIIVVDNGSRELPEAICKAYADVQLITEEEPGPGPARNKGISVAKAPLLAFIDADCIADENWLSAITAAFDTPDTQVIGGDVRIAYANPDKLTMLEAYESVYAYRQKEYIEKQGFSGTGNLAMRRSVYDEVGPFAGIGVAEDIDWGHRAGKLGIKICYVETATVYHPARNNLYELSQKWDRHTAHFFRDVRVRPFGRLRWATRILAMALSPVFEIVRIFQSKRISGLHARFLAFTTLTHIRFYRAKIMTRLLFSGSYTNGADQWNRIP